MTDKKPTHQERLRGILHPEGKLPLPPKKDAEPEEELSCGAFGYLRGIRDLPGSVEFRFRGGNSAWFPYGWLGPWKYNPSEGLLLKFSGDLVYLVLIRGSNLAKPLAEGSINLTSGGLQRNRIVWIREMSEQDVRQVGDSGPTIDSIQIGEFDSAAAQKAWLKAKAPAFLPVEERAEA
jgi:hypothetical protein